MTKEEKFKKTCKSIELNVDGAFQIIIYIYMCVCVKL